MDNKKITIIGLGLIGGSLARAFRERLDTVQLRAVDKNTDFINMALKDGIIDDGSTELMEFAHDSDIIFICTPVKQAIDYIDSISGIIGADCIITDVCSTKGEIISHVDQMDRPPLFIGGHPMAGTERAGYPSSHSHLFENAYYILCPGRIASSGAVELLSSIISKIGAIPFIMDPQEHDLVTGCISHIPHIAAAALVNLARELDTPDAKMQSLAAGGFKDTTRIASSSPEMWENISISNKTQILNILDRLIHSLEEFKTFIDAEHRRKIYTYFESAKLYRDTFSNNVKGLIEKKYDIVADVVDKPGIIGEIATLLGSNGINIKNINVSNSREFEQGCLKITLPDESSALASLSLLKEAGYKAFKS